MKSVKQLILTSFFVLMYISTFSQDDSTLYVKTTFQHEIFNGRNTARKNAIKQEMRDAKGELFREVFYSTVTKQVDSVLYYFYNKNGSIRLVEKVNGNEKLFEYYKYSYKKNTLRKIERYNYNNQSNTSKLHSTQTFTTKKNKSFQKETDANNEVIKTTESEFSNKKLIKKTLKDFQMDSAHIKITLFEYQNDLVHKETDFVISKTSDTSTYYRTYSYNDKNLTDTIVTTDSNNEFLFHKMLSYTKKGSLINEKTIGKNNFYIENLTYELRKYFRDLPRKTPQF